MTASEKYRRIFGELHSLAQPVPWTTGLSNMLEWLTWSTNDVLGITKTRYCELILELSHDDALEGASVEEKVAFVNAALTARKQQSERSGRYDKPSSTVASPKEAPRRAKYFSEDYLNKEFDIFWGLVSDSYLDRYYGRLFDVAPGGQWFCHGNGGLFASSTRIKAMQMDNLSYNPERKVLVANELKLGGRKNPDQILKYALMHFQLVERGFVDPCARLVLCFLGDREEAPNWSELIDQEIAYCASSTKSTSKSASTSECIAIAMAATFVSTTWADLIQFNDGYSCELDPRSQQVEIKLLRGFNETLRDKAFLRTALRTSS